MANTKNRRTSFIRDSHLPLWKCYVKQEQVEMAWRQHIIKPSDHLILTCMFLLDNVSINSIYLYHIFINVVYNALIWNNHQEHLSSSRFDGACVARDLFFCVLSCRSVFVLVLLTIILFVFRFTIPLTLMISSFVSLIKFLLFMLIRVNVS